MVQTLGGTEWLCALKRESEDCYLYDQHYKIQTNGPCHSTPDYYVQRNQKAKNKREYVYIEKAVRAKERESCKVQLTSLSRDQDEFSCCSSSSCIENLSRSGTYAQSFSICKTHADHRRTPELNTVSIVKHAGDFPLFFLPSSPFPCLSLYLFPAHLLYPINPAAQMLGRI